MLLQTLGLLRIWGHIHDKYSNTASSSGDVWSGHQVSVVLRQLYRENETQNNRSPPSTRPGQALQGRCSTRARCAPGSPGRTIETEGSGAAASGRCCCSEEGSCAELPAGPLSSPFRTFLQISALPKFLSSHLRKTLGPRSISLPLSLPSRRSAGSDPPPSPPPRQPARVPGGGEGRAGGGPRLAKVTKLEILRK